MRTALLLHALVNASIALAYIWPNPKFDRLESLRFEHGGPGSGVSLGVLLIPCHTFSFVDGDKSGRINAADWIRTAYHDMATYNIVDGTGGIDASIQFQEEQSRAENAGDGFANTLLFLRAVTGPHVSLADMIAMGLVVAVEQCGGPYIPYRAGRIDATKPGPPGVPQPHEKLESHVESFARQGFTKTEMISLVACGHTMGGVQQITNPDIVPVSMVSPENTSGNSQFDASIDSFDNNVATEYIKGTTNNPLVVGPNVTTRSDARIFSSDGNFTMQAFAKSPTLFRKTCSSLFARMIDTVPRGVKLTDVLEPLPVKPIDVIFNRRADGSLVLGGRVRFWNLKEDSARTIDLVWADQKGRRCVDCSIRTTHDPTRDFITTMPGNHTSLLYVFPEVNMTSSSSKFWFEIREGKRLTIEDQAGRGFLLDSDVIASSTTCMYREEEAKLKVDIAVRKGLNPTRVFVLGQNAVPIDDVAVFNKTLSAQDKTHDIWTGHVSAGEVPGFPGAFGNMFSVGAEVNGKNLTAISIFSAANFREEC